LNAAELSSLICKVLREPNSSVLNDDGVIPCARRIPQQFRKRDRPDFPAKGGDKVPKFAQLPAADAAEDVSASVLEALDCLRIAVTLLDSDERLVYANTHFNYLFRSLPPHESLIGTSYADLIRLEVAGGEIAEPDALACDAFIARRRRQLIEGTYRPLDIPLANGRTIELKARRTRGGGWIILWTDVTEARNLFGRLEDAIELSADAFAFWDRGDRLILCNNAFAEMHGAPAPAALVHMPFEELIRDAVRRGRFAIEGHVENWIERRLEAHRAPAGALTVTTSEGPSYLVRERATREGGSATVITDVTERRRIEAALTEQTRALQRTRKALQKTKTEVRRRASYLADLTRQLDAAEAEADTAKTTLLRTMSHELKTPLNAIIGFSDLLGAMPGRFSAEQIGEYAGLIRTAGGNLLRLINQILDLTRISAGRFPLHKIALPISSALYVTVDALAGRAADKQISLQVEDCGADLFVHADENALVMMIANLAENAIAFTQAGGRVTLCAIREEDFVSVVIADNGPGVAPEDLERILAPFEQAGRGTTDHSHGAGLGLPLVKSLAELHGGAFTVANGEAGGLIATLELPSA
jgi:two-component system cell cycle sensor histidine kinase PleC